MSKTYVVCSVCGRKEEIERAKRNGWLVKTDRRGGGRMVIRCPQHITDYARRMAKEATR